MTLPVTWVCKYFGSVPERSPLRHSTPLECRGLGIPSSIDISRRWREEILTYLGLTQFPGRSGLKPLLPGGDGRNSVILRKSYYQEVPLCSSGAICL